METSKSNINLDTNFLRNLRLNFKPSLLTRIILDGGAKPQTGGGKIMRGGAEDAKHFVTYGINPELELHDFVDEWMSRALIKLFILTLSMYFAYLTVGSGFIRRKLFDNVNMDPSTEYAQPSGDDFKDKYKKIVIYILIFVLFTAYYSFIIEQLPYPLIYMYYSYNKRIGDNVQFLAVQTYHFFFNKFPCKQGMGNMDFFNSMERYALFGILLYFIVYFFLVKSFINTMRYPKYDLNRTEDEELPTEKKFLIYYSLTILFTILFMMGMFVAHFTYKKPFNLLYMALVVALYSLLVNFLFCFILKKRKILVIVMFISLFILVLLNIYFLQAKVRS